MARIQIQELTGTAPLKPEEQKDLQGGAQADYYLKVQGVDGEATDSRHRDQIEILSFSWGVSQSGTY